MTTLAAVHKPGYGTVFGSDTLVSSNVKCYIPTGKWFSSNGYAVGISGALKTTNIVQHHVEHLLDDLDSSSETEFVFQFAGKLTQLLASMDYKSESDDIGAKSICHGVMLVSAKKVWSLDPTLSFIEIAPNVVYGDGSGGGLAMGAGFATASMSPVKRIETAIRAGIAMDTYSGGDIVIGILREKRKR